MASAKNISIIARNDLYLVHVVQLKPTIKDQISGKLVTNGISDVAIASVNSEKTLTKKMIMIIIIITEKAFTRLLNTDYAGPLQLKEFYFSYLFLRQ